MTPTLSVVVVAFRARDHTLECLRSLRDDAGLDHETIVVDDGSGDGTPEAVAAAYPDVRVVAKGVNEGLAAGRNAALPLVRGRYVLMLDADTQVRPGALQRMVDVMESDSRVGLVGPRLVGADGALQLSARRYPPLLIPVLRRGPYAWLNDDPAPHRWHLMKDDDHGTERPVVWVQGAAQLWRAELPSLIGAYDTRVSSYGGEDIDWCLRVWRAGYEVRYAPEAEIVHAWQQVTHTNQFGRSSWRAFRDWYYLQWKHRGLRGDPRLEAANA